MSDCFIWFIVGLSLGAALLLCIYRGHESHVETENKALEDEIKIKDKKIDDLKNDLKRARDDISNLTKLPKTAPADCKEGAWCESCEFAKTYTARAGIWGSYTKLYCGKEEACKNFVQVKVDKE